MTSGSNPAPHQAPDAVDLNQHPDAGTSLGALEQFRRLLLEHRDLERTLQGVCEQVTVTVAGADMAGVTMIAGPADPADTAAATDPKVVGIDVGQYRANEGPCLEAARTGTVVRAGAADVAARWPRFAARLDAEVASFLSAPLTLGTGRVGALNLYSYHDHGFAEVDEVLLTTYVTAVEAAVVHAQRAALAEAELDGLHQAMHSRAVIEQAKGIIMALRGCTEDDAFAVLSRESQNRNIKLTVLARNLIDTAAHGGLGQ